MLASIPRWRDFDSKAITFVMFPDVALIVSEKNIKKKCTCEPGTRQVRKQVRLEHVTKKLFNWFVLYRIYIYIFIYIYIYILYKYITYLALKTMIVQNNIKQIYTIGLAAAAAAA